MWIEVGVGPNAVEIVQSYAPNLQTAAQLYASGTALTETAGSLNVNITGGASSDVQYANGTAVATPTGTVALGFDGSNVRALNTDATGQLKVLVQNTPAVTVSGSVAVTQGTSPWVVSLASTTITGTVAVTQSTSPWIINVSNIVDPNNSTLTPLGAGATFTGLQTDVSMYDSIRLWIYSDQPSSFNGLTLFWSADGVNWDTDQYNIAAGDGVRIVNRRRATYFRLSYQNNAITPQTIFQLQTWLEPMVVDSVELQLNDSISTNNSAGLVRNLPFGRSAYGTGVFNDATIKNPSTAPTVTDPALVVSISPNSAAITADSSGSGTSNATAAAWTSGTATNSTVAVYTTNFSYNTAIVTFNQTTTISGGVATFEVSNDGANWVSLNGVPTEGGSETSSYNFQANTYTSFTFNISGWQNFRVRLSTGLTGSGTVTVGYALQTTGTPVSAVVAAKDSGRNYLTFYIDAASGITAEALETMTINSGGNTSTATSYTVTTGKTLRLQSISTAVQETNSTVQTSKVRLRSATSVTATSPVLWGSFVSTAGATHDIGNNGSSFPDGLEVAGGQQIAISHVESATASNVTVTLVGYEY